MGYFAVLILLIFTAPLVLAFVHDFRFNKTEFTSFVIREKRKLLFFAMGIVGYLLVNYLTELAKLLFP